MNLKKVALYFIVLSGCNSITYFDKPFQKEILRFAEANCNGKDSCFIDLATLTNFAWDKLFIFPELTDSKQISNATGFRYVNITMVPDGKKRMIFVKGMKVVHEENFASSFTSEPFITHIGFPIDTTSFSKSKNYYTRLMPEINNTDAKYIIYKITSKNQKKHFYSLSPRSDLGKKFVREY